MRVLCTNSARSELRGPVEREGPAQGYDELWEDAFFDWETSDGNLRDLEARIAAFCSAKVNKIYISLKVTKQTPLRALRYISTNVFTAKN